VIGTFKTEVIAIGTVASLEAVGLATSRVSSRSTRARLLEAIDYVPPEKIRGALPCAGPDRLSHSNQPPTLPARFKHFAQASR
jgi:hypothetical protein